MASATEWAIGIRIESIPPELSPEDEIKGMEESPKQWNFLLDERERMTNLESKRLAELAAELRDAGYMVHKIPEDVGHGHGNRNITRRNCEGE